MITRSFIKNSFKFFSNNLKFVGSAKESTQVILDFFNKFKNKKAEAPDMTQALKYLIVIPDILQRGLENNLNWFQPTSLLFY
jgi:hypothetical protein